VDEHGVSPLLPPKFVPLRNQ